MESLKHSEERYLRYDFTAVETHDLSTSLANQVQQKANITAEKKRRCLSVQKPVGFGRCAHRITIR